MILHCPLCHGQFSIEALIQDQAGRDLLVLMAQSGALGPQLLQYLTLFRSQKRAPAADTIGYTADIWFRQIPGCTVPEVDQPRIRAAFDSILAAAKEWPEPGALREHLPRRPERAKIGHELTEEQRRAGREAARALKERLES